MSVRCLRKAAQHMALSRERMATRSYVQPSTCWLITFTIYMHVI